MPESGHQQLEVSHNCKNVESFTHKTSLDYLRVQSQSAKSVSIWPLNGKASLLLSIPTT